VCAPSHARRTRNVQGSAPKQLKKQLLRKLQRAYCALALLPAPSRLVEALYIWGDMSDKEVIAAALAQELRSLQVRVSAPSNVV
jgi:hypothetical protein